ncbi:TetR/AcrR family transcriptional regulator [Frigoriflavimonas asaccharolytica]|uniref:AcrR family transcriptional regulator n=1 Tax=Frigoriflavimonas asaccharolytica TaxID=2735899 RepID=A0A8J8K9E7_9FLAO|nr:TetR/AcrR family transcriptional regulator [Frigoriflavimonas asaccharolytica]NRS93002.1 AcrR family transcriptional regulator [Frigoriflavimonas asaccharolytica]
MTDKNQFLQKVSELFYEQGAKSLTMDDIAKEFSMSKKTLYQQYTKKEELIAEVLQFILDEMVKNLQIDQIEDVNPIANMFCREQNMQEFSKSNRTLFIRQLQKYYPNLFENHLVEMDKKISTIIVGNIEKGRKLNLYRKDFDAAFYSKLLLHLFISVESSILFEGENSDKQREEEKNEIMKFFLNSIATEKGTEILKNYN